MKKIYSQVEPGNLCPEPKFRQLYAEKLAVLSLEEEFPQVEIFHGNGVALYAPEEIENKVLERFYALTAQIYEEIYR